jgi:aminoglycoside phosphotransferase (APT) family kinase protein
MVRAAALAGLDPDDLDRIAPAATAEVWANSDFVLRVHDRPDLRRLVREAAIAARLAPQAMHPGVLDHGRDEDLEWLLMPRVRGVQLSRAWPLLDEGDRARAVAGFAAALEALHATPTDGLPGDEDMSPPHVLPLERAVAQARRVDVEPQLLTEAIGFMEAVWDAFDDDGRGLAHADPHFENVLWDGERVVALLDLDWTHPTWLAVDLETLLSFFDHPWFFVAADYEDVSSRTAYAQATGWLRAAYPTLFEHGRITDRLAFLGIDRTLGLLAEHPPARPWDREDPRDRRNHLRSIMDGTSHLHRMVLD